MYKRKSQDYNHSDLINKINNQSYQSSFNNTYHDLKTCNKIMLIDNHIYFNSIINETTISILLQYINVIYLNNQVCSNNYDSNNIYLHINSKGGQLKSILPLLEIKNKSNIEIVSIIEQECNDAAILLASICNYRIIKKNAICKLSSYTDLNLSNNLPYFWDYFKQCNNNFEEIAEFKNILYSLFTQTIDSKITIDKLSLYLNQNNNWNSKKYRKLGLADEII